MFNQPEAHVPDLNASSAELPTLTFDQLRNGNGRKVPIFLHVTLHWNPFRLSLRRNA